MKTEVCDSRDCNGLVRLMTGFELRGYKLPQGCKICTECGTTYGRTVSLPEMEIKTKRVLTHFVQMDTYEVPESICEKGNEAIEDYIQDNELEPVKSDGRDFEVVEVLEN